MTMAEQRSLPTGWTDSDEWPCLFCGRLISHVNSDTGTGWIVRDEQESYIVCYVTPCVDLSVIWTHCDYDQIGDACAECGASRSS